MLSPWFLFFRLEEKKIGFQIKKWRKKSTNSGAIRAKKHYISGFTEFSVDHIGVEKERIVGMWAEMDATERLVYEKRAPRRCPHSVDEVNFLSQDSCLFTQLFWFLFFCYLFHLKTVSLFGCQSEVNFAESCVICSNSFDTVSIHFFHFLEELLFRFSFTSCFSFFVVLIMFLHLSFFFFSSLKNFAGSSLYRNTQLLKSFCVATVMYVPCAL